MEETGGLTTHIPPPSSSSTLADESCINYVFGSVPTRAEADYSMTAFQSFMNLKGQSMLVENPEFQIVETAFQFMKKPMVKEMVRSVMCDIGVIAAILGNDAVQAFLSNLMLGSSAKRLTKAITDAAASNCSPLQESHNEHNLVSVILSWLLENIESGFLGFVGILRSLVNNSNESPQNENIGSGSGSGKFTNLIMFLSIINLLIVFVGRALKQKLMV